MKKDIEGIDDIKLMVGEFYDKVKADPLLGPVFFEKIPGDWQPHLEKMYLFWNAALFGVKGYTGNPFAKHATMPLASAHFERWLLLFNTTVNSLFEGPIAEDAKWRAALMASNFLRRITDLEQSPLITIV